MHGMGKQEIWWVAGPLVCAAVLVVQALRGSVDGRRWVGFWAGAGGWIGGWVGGEPGLLRPSHHQQQQPKWEASLASAAAGGPRCSIYFWHPLS